MPAVSEDPKHLFLEKDRKASFKSWPFTERHACSVTKVSLSTEYKHLITFSHLLLQLNVQWQDREPINAAKA